MPAAQIDSELLATLGAPVTPKRRTGRTDGNGSGTGAGIGNSIPVVDRKKAGVPGPGAYATTSLFSPPTQKYTRATQNGKRGQKNTGRLRTVPIDQMTKSLTPYQSSLVGNAGKHVFESSPAYTMSMRDPSPAKRYISSLHTADTLGIVSPGPKYGTPSPKVRTGAPLTGAARHTEAKRFISEGHNTELLTKQSPGPMYGLATGKGIVNTFGDGPAAPFVTGGRHNVVPRDASLIPGPGQYPVVRPMQTTGGSFSPRGSAPGHKQYHKLDDHAAVISKQHAAHDNKAWKVNPGVGNYDLMERLRAAENADESEAITLEVMSLSRKTSATKLGARTGTPNAVMDYVTRMDASITPGEMMRTRDRVKMNQTFAKAPRSPQHPTKHQLYNEENLPHGWADAMYDTRPRNMDLGTSYHVSDHNETFGTMSRTVYPERGGNKGGPLISAQHSKAALMCTEGPGHLYDIVKYDDMSEKNGIKFPLEDRRMGLPKKSPTEGPGPGAYLLKFPEGQTVKFGTREGYKGALDMPPDIINVPGPGAYETDQLTPPSPTRTQSAAQAVRGTFGGHNGRTSYLQPTISRGPGADFPAEPMAEDILFETRWKRVVSPTPSDRLERPTPYVRPGTTSPARMRRADSPTKIAFDRSRRMSASGGSISQRQDSDRSLLHDTSIRSLSSTLELDDEVISPEEDKLRRAYVSKMKATSLVGGSRYVPAKQYLSPQHAAASKMGSESPGPKYAPQEMSRPSTRGPMGGKDKSRPASTFGYSRRDKGGVYMGQAFSNVSNTEQAGRQPGPGQYVDTPILKTKFYRAGAATFGTSIRPSLAKETF